ncbi:hypothetical protein ABEB36_001206 [Hypothenemus hampei]|uniref:Uncharacterized protein n=1 Tax=Hypothenemus hampei TaxID=57062 RepID=A0ABD1FHD7_HYPHA
MTNDDFVAVMRPSSNGMQPVNQCDRKPYVTPPHSTTLPTSSSSLPSPPTSNTPHSFYEAPVKYSIIHKITHLETKIIRNTYILGYERTFKLSQKCIKMATNYIICLYGCLKQGQTHSGVNGFLRRKIQVFIYLRPY